MICEGLQYPCEALATHTLTESPGRDIAGNPVVLTSHLCDDCYAEWQSWQIGKPTPGEWHVSVEEDRSYQTYDHLRASVFVGEPDGSGSYRVLAHLPEHRQELNPELRANALLFGAAKDLLDALERLVHTAECGILPGPNTLAQARTAITKAKGSQTEAAA